MSAAARYLGKTHKFLHLSGFLLTVSPVSSLIPWEIISAICRSTIKHINGRGNTILNGGFLKLTGKSFRILLSLRKFWGKLQKRRLWKPAYRKDCRSFAAGSDKGCEILGSGCLTPETGCLSFGTIATFDVATPKYVELRPMIPPYPASVPDAYYTEVSIFRGFWMVSWFKEEFGLQECMLAEKNNEAPEKFFDSLIQNVPAGSMGLMLQPYWTPGEQTLMLKDRLSVLAMCTIARIFIAPYLKDWSMG